MLRTFAIQLLVFISSNVYAATHCLPLEFVYFSCKIKGTSNVASLCSNQADVRGDVPKDMWLQYRFGRVGHIKLIYPKNKKGSLSLFQGEHNFHRNPEDDNQNMSSTVVYFHAYKTMYTQ